MLVALRVPGRKLVSGAGTVITSGALVCWALGCTMSLTWRVTLSRGVQGKFVFCTESSDFSAFETPLRMS